jgi:hypothetical protein
MFLRYDSHNPLILSLSLSLTSSSSSCVLRRNREKPCCVCLRETKQQESGSEIEKKKRKKREEGTEQVEFNQLPRVDGESTHISTLELIFHASHSLEVCEMSESFHFQLSMTWRCARANQITSAWLRSFNAISFPTLALAQRMELRELGSI